MAEEPTSPELLDVDRRAIEAVGRRDFDAAVSMYRPDSVWDVSAMGMGTYHGVEAIRRELEQWTEAYETFYVEIEEIHGLGNGVTFAVCNQGGSPRGSSGQVEMRFASVTEWTDGLIARVTVYPNIDDARAAAQRLAEPRR
jgi:ketosteroid isomerase-like protein